jgi:hypothetical protein
MSGRSRANPAQQEKKEKKRSRFMESTLNPDPEIAEKRMAEDIAVAAVPQDVPMLPKIRQLTMENVASQAINLGLARKPTGEIIGSYRLNPEVLAATPSDEQLNAMFVEVTGKGVDAPEIPEVAVTGGSRHRQKGGDWKDDVAKWTKAKYELTTQVIVMTKTTFQELASKARVQLGEKWDESAEKRAAAIDAVKAYMGKELAPLGTVGQKSIAILGRLLEQIAVRTPITLAVASLAGLGATANFVRFVFDISNTWIRETATNAVDDERAKKAAAAALASAKSVTSTTIAGVVVANQLGIVSLSAVLAAILFTLQVNLGTGAGRAYLITGFYAWFNAQDPGKQEEIKKAAEEYAAAAKERVKPKITAAAQNLGKLLATGAERAKGKIQNKNAVQAVVANAAGEEAPRVAVPEQEAGVISALDKGAPAAAEAAAVEEVAAAAAEAASSNASGAPAVGESAEKGAPKRRTKRLNAAAPPFPAAAPDEMQTGQGRRGKTKKGKSKRRVTRRRKAPKYLAAPVFVY